MEAKLSYKEYRRGVMFGLRLGMIYARRAPRVRQNLIEHHDEIAMDDGEPLALEIPGMKEASKRGSKACK